MKNKILLIGGIGAGKTTLRQRLLHEAMIYRKTQVLDFKGLFIDCPGEYIQIPTYYRVLIDASHRVQEVWALQDASAKRSPYPPNFAHVFKNKVVGIVTKQDRKDAKLAVAEKYLQQAGFGNPIYTISAKEGTGMEPLVQRLAELLKPAAYEQSGL